tara:strand:+ start:5992 stop:6690 length:699 start_codon:yes stop_codon:yes gene_type:complete
MIAIIDTWNGEGYSDSGILGVFSNQSQVDNRVNEFRSDNSQFEYKPHKNGWVGYYEYITENDIDGEEYVPEDYGKLHFIEFSSEEILLIRIMPAVNNVFVAGRFIDKEVARLEYESTCRHIEFDEREDTTEFLSRGHDEGDYIAFEMASVKDLAPDKIYSEEEMQEIAKITQVFMCNRGRVSVLASLDINIRLAKLFISKYPSDTKWEGGTNMDWEEHLWAFYQENERLYGW